MSYPAIESPPATARCAGHAVPSVLLMLALGVLTACAAVVDKYARPAPEFERQATEYLLKSPSWRFRDRFYHVSLGDYAIRSVDTSGVKSEGDRLVNWSVENTMLEDFLFLGKIVPEITVVGDYEVHLGERFSYVLYQGDEARLSAECRARYIRRRDKDLASFRIGPGVEDNRRWYGSPSDSWQSTQVECAIEHRGTLWSLGMIARVDEAPEYRLRSHGRQFDFKPMSTVTMRILDRDGKEREFNNTGSDVTQIAGLELFKGPRQVAALSTVGNKNRIWMIDALDNTDKEVLFGALYGLLLANWLNHDRD